MQIAPAAFSFRVTSASSAGTRSSNTALAAVVRKLAVSMLSFSPIGIPWSGPRNLPAFCSASSCLACATACERITEMNAFSFGL